MSFATESTPLLPSFQSTHRKSQNTCSVLALPRALFSFLVWAATWLTSRFYWGSFEPILPSTVSPTPNPTSHETSLSKSEETTMRTVFPQESTLVVVARSELPTTTYPISSLKKSPSYDSIPAMKEKSVRFSAIIDIHEFSRLVGEPFGMAQPTKAPGVKNPRMENELRHSERTRLTLELEPAPMKSYYNPRLIDDDNDYSSRSRYD